MVCNSPRRGKLQTNRERTLLAMSQLKCEWDMHSAGDTATHLGYLSGHIGRHIDGAHGG